MVNKDLVIAESNSEKAELMVNFFSEVFTRETSVLPKEDFKHFEPNVQFRLPNITDKMVDKLLESLDVSKSPGVDE
jgi:hypothetical protein